MVSRHLESMANSYANAYVVVLHLNFHFESASNQSIWQAPLQANCVHTTNVAHHSNIHQRWPVDDDDAVSHRLQHLDWLLKIPANGFPGNLCKIWGFWWDSIKDYPQFVWLTELLCCNHLICSILLWSAAIGTHNVQDHSEVELAQMLMVKINVNSTFFSIFLRSKTLARDTNVVCVVSLNFRLCRFS